MHTSLAPFGQVLRKLCRFKPLQSWEPHPGHCWSTALSRDSAQVKVPYLLAHTPNEVFLSILEWARHELRIALGFTLMTPSLRGWEALPTPGALTHTRISWALSPPRPQVPVVTPGSPLCPWCFRHPFGEVRDTYIKHNQMIYKAKRIIPVIILIIKIMHILEGDPSGVEICDIEQTTILIFIYNKL